MAEGTHVCVCVFKFVIHMKVSLTVLEEAVVSTVNIKIFVVTIFCGFNF